MIELDKVTNNNIFCIQYVYMYYTYAVSIYVYYFYVLFCIIKQFI